MTTVLRRQLGRQLRQLREAAGKTLADVREAGLASPVKLWRIESGQVVVKVGDVRGLCWLYEADIATTDMLTRWAVGSREPGWWEDFDQPMSTRAGLYAGLEATAHHLYIYELGQVPDLLQTADCARAHYLAVHPSAAQTAVHDFVKHRQERQAALTQRIPPMRLTAVLAENALTRPFGTPEAIREQIELLVELAHHVHIDIRYLPSSSGIHSTVRSGGFTILEFVDPDDPDLVYVETHTGARYLERPDELAEHRRIFERVYSLSVPASEYGL
ncbi:helix-turn-helix transcriptional regulator [Virgisporangium ochraceum]|uniref:Transcriptional regulator n=1 Tax=Virgisporangium ochraceum TaxID=65505 RepID=A0A8J4A730_9ACTN|nr:helix-turn-helix transcriptional regulator [Virgisporangium ochraceum]GIJ74046.1 transcriptional regulator [Virgisporangium ochraceum]